MPNQTFPSIEQRFRGAIAAAAGLGPDRFDHPGTVVVPAPDREGSSMAVVYGIGRTAMVWCDPAVADRVAGLADAAVTVPLDTVESWVSSLPGAEFVGGAWSHLITAGGLDSPSTPAGHDLRLLDSEDPVDRTLIEGLVGVCGEDDADYAEIEMDDLDQLIVGLIDPSNALVGYASARPWEHDAGFGDIGVLTHTGRRGQGLGRVVVARISREMFDTAALPLYRCNWDRTPSRRLALSLGFREVLSLAAVRFE